MFTIIFVVISLYIGYKLHELKIKLQTGMEFKICGLDVVIGKPQKSEVVDIKKTVKCKTCNDENMYIKGTKHLIPCPKCKRNEKKFKGVVK